MIRQYRPRMNVVLRPTQEGGVGYQFTGHHEIMLPLLAAAVLETLASCGSSRPAVRPAQNPAESDAHGFVKSPSSSRRRSESLRNHFEYSVRGLYTETAHSGMNAR
jgi:hypothetical protein